MRKTMTLLAAVMTVSSLLGQTTDAASWRNLSRLAPGQSIEVTTKKGESLKGTFASVSEGAISLERKHQSVAVPQAEVARVSLRSSKRLNYTLAGLAIGAGAGLKPAIIGAGCAIGALVGTLVGSWLGGRGATVYRAK
jgi:phage tail tape-measure protein